MGSQSAASASSEVRKSSDRQTEREREREREMDSYTQHMPVLQRTTFWSDYMSGLKGSLAARTKVKETVMPSLFGQYRAVDVTMYDLIYGRETEARSERSGYDHYRPLHTSI